MSTRDEQLSHNPEVKDSFEKEKRISEVSTRHAIQVARHFKALVDSRF